MSNRVIIEQQLKGPDLGRLEIVWDMKDVDYYPDAPTINVIRMSAFSFVLLVILRFSCIDSFINMEWFYARTGNKI